MRLGILGGCGPAAGAYFYTRLIALTRASTDGEHVDVLLSGIASTPDRTAYLRGQGEAPTGALIAAGRALQGAGAELLVLPCHTAHAFLAPLRASLSIPVLDMIALCMAHVAAHGLEEVGVLCTVGTRLARLYDRAAEPHGVRVLYPNRETQAVVQSSIYTFLKQGRSDGGAAIRTACGELGARGCPAVVLACTELSLPAAQPHVALHYQRHRPAAFLPQALIDPLEILARHAIVLCGKQIKEEREHATAHLAGGTAYL